MNEDVLEVLQELETYLNNLNGVSPDVNNLFEFIEHQRSIYSGSTGECSC